MDSDTKPIGGNENDSEIRAKQPKPRRIRDSTKRVSDRRKTVCCSKTVYGANKSDRFINRTVRRMRRQRGGTFRSGAGKGINVRAKR